MNYVKEIDILDKSFFQKLANDHMTERWLELNDVDALMLYTDRTPINVNDYSYLKNIQKQYPKLQDYVKLLKSAPGGSWPPHIDRHRATAINIPIRNCDENGVTRFYKDYHEVEFTTAWFGNQNKLWSTNPYVQYVEGGTIAFEHVLLEPTIINTKIPHDIINSGTKTRIICSWEYRDTFDNAVIDLCP
tara:strand:- start:188 stop:754 length:567 start_codon:yes stop_codon:yes gene_type:complete